MENSIIFIREFINGIITGIQEYDQLKHRNKSDRLDLRYIENKEWIEKNNILFKILEPEKKKRKNQGEKDEVKIINDLRKYANEPEALQTFGFDPDLVSNGIHVINPITKIPYDAKAGKTSWCYKADTCVLFSNGREARISIKSLRGGAYAIVNHTNRGALVFQEGVLSKNIKEYDDFNEAYRRWKITNKRDDIKGEVFTNELWNNLNSKQQIAFIDLLIYFIFIGTGKQKSKLAANSILLMKKDGTLKFDWCDTDEKKEQYVKRLIEENRLQVSFRSSKGMPLKISPVLQKWCEGNNRKGAIHIRVFR